MLKRSKDLADPGLTGMCSYEDVLDVLRLWGSGLQIRIWSVVSVPGRSGSRKELAQSYEP